MSKEPIYGRDLGDENDYGKSQFTEQDFQEIVRAIRASSERNIAAFYEETSSNGTKEEVKPWW
jgi:hypothetical protein